MKISLRILLINFVIVVLVFVSSTIAFYTLTKKLISLQHSRALQYSTNDFTLAFSNTVNETDDDFVKFLSSCGKDFRKSPADLPQIENMRMDFLLIAARDSVIIWDRSFHKSSVQMDSINTIENFLARYPNVILRQYAASGLNVWYGRIISRELLNNLSKRVRAEVALLYYGVPVAISNEKINDNYIHKILKASDVFRNNGYKGIVTEEHPQADFYASLYQPKELLGTAGSSLKFIIFSPLPEASELRGNITIILFIIGLAGVGLSLVLVLLFTSRIRAQLVRLSSAAENAKNGDLKSRVDIVSPDEIGKLAGAFNSMMDELERNEALKAEYTEFLALINRNPGLNEVSSAVLKKIIHSTGVDVGKLSIVEDDSVKAVVSHGLSNKCLPEDSSDLYRRVIGSGEVMELRFTENFPVIATGLMELKVRYLLIYPVIYNSKVIALLELAGITDPGDKVRTYLDNIHDQLAIGLTNSTAFMRLEIQKEKAEEAASLKSQFLASMSHELRTPLSSIIGLSELILRDSSVNAEVKKKLGIIGRNGKRLLKLINDILDFSKAEAGKMEIHTETFSLRELITDVEHQIRPLLSEKNISGEHKVEFFVANELPERTSLSSDREKVMQVLLNLLGNAVKFTEKGVIRLTADRSAPGRLVFTITDSGIGIDQKNMAMIFEEFRQVDATSARKYSGTGLGLAISRKYAELLGGSLECQSEPGEGSVFTLSIPAEINTEATGVVTERLQSAAGVQEISGLHEAGKPAVSEAAGPEERIVKGSVVVLEENENTRNVISEYLSSKYYEVFFAGNAAESLDIIRRQTPAAIVMNMSLPEASSWRMLKTIKEDEALRRVPVIPYTLISELNFSYGLNIFEFLADCMQSSQLQEILARLESISRKRTENVLLIDASANPLSEMLTELGINVFQLKDAQTAVKHAARMRPDVIITALSGQRTDGISIAYRLKESLDTKEIPLVLAFNSDMEEKDYFYLNNSFEKAALRAKRNPIDLLKVVRDRIRLEEQNPGSEWSDVWIDLNDEKQNDVKDRTKSKVLIVDDDADTLFTVSEIVSGSGCETVLAKNGLECLETLKSVRPDLILLDIMMPEMDGFETIKRIRADKALSEIPVVALTAIAMSEENQIVIRNGFNDYLPKPVNAELLSFKIENMLR